MSGIDPTRSSVPSGPVVAGAMIAKPHGDAAAICGAVWTRDTAIHNQYAGSDVWSKPDSVSNNFELRRLTTPRNVAWSALHNHALSEYRSNVVILSMRGVTS